jgi:hypothetical protein
VCEAAAAALHGTQLRPASYSKRELGGLADILVDKCVQGASFRNRGQVYVPHDTEVLTNVEALHPYITLLREDAVDQYNKYHKAVKLTIEEHLPECAALLITTYKAAVMHIAPNIGKDGESAVNYAVYYAFKKNEPGVLWEENSQLTRTIFQACMTVLAPFTWCINMRQFTPGGQRHTRDFRFLSAAVVGGLTVARSKLKHTQQLLQLAAVQPAAPAGEADVQAAAAIELDAVDGHDEGEPAADVLPEQQQLAAVQPIALANAAGVLVAAAVELDGDDTDDELADVLPVQQQQQQQQQQQ